MIKNIIVKLCVHEFAIILLKAKKKSQQMFQSPHKKAPIFDIKLEELPASDITFHNIPQKKRRPLQNGAFIEIFKSRRG